MSKSSTSPAFERFAAVRNYQPTLSYSPDGQEIAYSVNISGQYNIWRQPVEGGYPRQVTTFDNETVRAVHWSPDGQQFLFSADSHGDEFTAPHTVSTLGGEVTRLTDEPEVQYSVDQPAWSNDGRFVHYSGNDREPTAQDVIVRDMSTGVERRILAGESNFGGIAFSPDGKYLSALELKANTDIAPYLIDIESGEATKLPVGEDGEIRVAGPWLPDSSGLYVLTNHGREFLGAGIYDIATNEFRWDLTPNWDIEQLAISGDGSLLVWAVNEDGKSSLHARDLATGNPVALPEIPLGVIGTLEIAPDGSSIAILLASPRSSTELYIVDLKAGETRQITFGMLGGIPTESFIEPSLIRYETHDGREIPAWLYKPVGDGPFPVVLSIHGGPEAQERPTYNYNGFYQYLLSRGIGVLAPNVRGSSGYGISYQKLIHRDWGGDELKDFEYAHRYLTSLPWVRNDRIGVFGGSFGGFATLSCVSRLPDLWAAAVDLVGPSNLVTFAKAVPPTWRSIMKEWVGDPYTEVDFMMSRSPITYVDQIKTPLFVIQGANDPRVVKPESDQIVERLRERGVKVRYDVYEDEGHGFTKRSNALKAIGDSAAFFVEHLNR